jgi:O-methyltransferase domain
MESSLSSTHIRVSNEDTQSIMRLVEMSIGYWLPRALHVVTDLGVADALDEEARSAADLAKKVGADPDALDRVLRLLASHGVFHRRGGQYLHNALSRVLRCDHPHSMRAYVRLVGLPVFWKSWGALEQVVRSGKPAVSDIFADLKEHPHETEIFDAGMKSKAEIAISPVLEAYDFSGFGTIGDIGGGLGHLLKAILKSSPKSRGILFDQPHVIERVEADAAIGSRLTTEGGDFFRGPLPHCDAYILMEVIHDWTDQQSQQILQQIRNSAPDLAKLLIVETMLRDESAWATDKARHFAHHGNVNMLVLTGGRERTSDEFARLFVSSGWRLSRVIPTPSPYSIVEAVAA